MMNPKLEALIATFKLPKTPNDSLDYTKMTTEQYFAFRHAFVQERMYNETFMANTGSQAMTMILDTICQILCNKTPKGIVSFRPDSIISKIKLVSAPRGVETERRVTVEKVSISADYPTGEKKTVIEKNTNERAIVRIMVPKRTMTLSEVNAEAKPVEDGTEGPTSPQSAKEEDEEKKGDDKSPAEPLSPTSVQDEKESQPNVSRLSRVPSEKIIEQDQDERSLIIANRINLQTPYMVYVMHQYAARAHRSDFIEQIRSKIIDFFTDNPKTFKQI